MNRTEKLLMILFILIISFAGYVFYVYRKDVIKSVKLFISNFKENEVIIPYEDTKNHNNYTFKTVKETDDFKPHNMEDLKNIYYTVLNNGWDSFTFYCPKDYETCADDVRMLANDNTYISLINNYINPYNTYKKYNTLITNDKEIYLKIYNLYNNEDIYNLNNEIDRIFKELNIDVNNYKNDDIKKLHDYLINNVTYDENYQKGTETISNKANGALFDGTALCSGYTDAFALMLDKLKIPNFKVSNEEHIWNIVYFNNEWKHVDVTWDDDERNKNNIYNFYMLDTNELLEKDNDVHNFTRSNYLELK